MKRTKQLEQKFKALEDLLGIVFDNSDLDYPAYIFKINDYNMKPSGILGELYAKFKQTKEK